MRERRKFPRAELVCKLNIFYSSSPIRTKTQNIGEGGIMVVLKQETMRGIPMKIELFVEGRVIQCNGHTVWVVTRADPENINQNVFDTGIQFDDISEEDKRYISDLVKRLNMRSSGGKNVRTNL